MGADHRRAVGQSLAAANRDWARQLPTRLAGSKKRDRSAQRRDALLGILGTDWAGANRAYEAMCDTFDVMWHVAEPCVDIGPKRTLLAASRLPASLRATQEERAGPYAIHGRAELGPGASDPLLVRFGWDGKTFVGVGFREGQVLIAVWPASDRRYHFERRVDAPIETGKPFDFRVEVTATEVRAFVGGALSCAWPHAGHSVQHMQSVNLTNRIAWLENLVIEDLPASGK